MPHMMRATPTYTASASMAAPTFRLYRNTEKARTKVRVAALDGNAESVLW